MKYARSENGKVVQIIGNDPARLFAPEVAGLFRLCGPDVQQGWLDDGSAFAVPPVALAPVPQSVSMRQARLALLAIGKLPAVASAIAAMPSPQKEAAMIEWEYGQSVDRNWPFVVKIGNAIGLDAAGLDALFVKAVSL